MLIVSSASLDQLPVSEMFGISFLQNDSSIKQNSKCSDLEDLKYWSFEVMFFPKN